jgi:hypothetical protein
MFLFALLTACFEETACTTIAVGSVNVVVETDAGAAAPAATVVEFKAPNADWAPCESWSVGEWVCGWDVAGELEIRANAVDFAEATARVTVGQDECHVIPEAVTLTLASLDCTDVEVPSVIAEVVGAGGEALEAVEVTWARTNAEHAPQPCDAQGGGFWACAWEASGELEIQATAAGHVPQTKLVDVGADACHVETEQVRFELQWGAD